MLGAGNICLSLIVAIACLPAIHARSGTWQSAATPYQYNAVNYSAMNLTKVEELELPTSYVKHLTLRIIDTSKKTPGKPNGLSSRWYHE